jgi:branched-chain amino acid aminotransferase
VQETGASNFFLIKQGELLTRSLDTSFLHGVTRDSLLAIGRDMGYVTSERAFDVQEMLEWARTGEATLSGTAAVLAGVGTLIYRGTEHKVGSGEVGTLTKALRAQLIAIQQGEQPDRHGWLERVV